MQYHPYRGEYKTLKGSSNSEELDEYETYALCKRLNISPDDMKEMSFVSLVNILISNVEDKETTKKASKDDINNFVNRLKG